jgi:ABC-type transport system involved in multi-copper enzyme maturation permease subunit
MTVFPVIGRELRSAARHSFTYHLRVLGVGALLLASVLFGMEQGFRANRGGVLFGGLHFTLFMAIWIMVPLLTADCISRERRDGTLGLLFLTPLKAGGIVVAKGIVHGLRALTLWIAVLPVLAIPLLLGGVSLSQVLLSVMINFSAICWGLAAGLLASAWSKTWLRALLLAAILAFCFLLVMGLTAGVFLSPAFTRRGWPGTYASSIFAVVSGVGFITNKLGGWPVYLRLTAGTQLISALGKVTLLSIVALAVAVVIAGAKTRRIWQEEPPSARQLWWQTALCTPILWVSVLRRWMRWKLEHNPIGWLEQRTWSGRLVTWGWFAVIVSLYSAALNDPHFFRGYSGMQRATAWFLAFTIAASAAGSFQRERETGVLELLLVSPVGEGAIISGRLRGLWGQFLPAVALLLGVWMYFFSLFQNAEDDQAILFHAFTFLTLPVVGLYFSLRCRNFISALLCTLGVGLLLPLVAPPAVGLITWIWSRSDAFYDWRLRLSGQASFFQLVFAAVCWQALRGRLQRRAFPLERTEPSR